jgi:hypothetical protein
MLDTNKIIAGGTIATAFLAAVAIYYSNRQWHQEHRPHVVFSRPLEMLEPLTCEPATGRGTSRFRVWVKNIGNEDAQSVLPIPDDQLIFETPKEHEIRIQDIISLNRSRCQSLNVANTTPGFPLHAGAEISVDTPGSRASTAHPDNRRMQEFASLMVLYTEQDGARHQTIETERLILPNGERSFVCGQPIYGRFDIYPDGSCEN